MEIGGFLELETTYGKEYHSGAIRLNSGRNCLAYLIEVKNIESIALPYFICSSVIDVCKQYEIQIQPYTIDRDFHPQLKDLSMNDAYLYIVNYYGQLSNEFITRISKQYPKVIIDNAQAFFQPPVPNIDTLYTCRKFFGVPDGAYLYTDAVLEHELQQDLSFQRMQHLLGRFEETASRHYFEFTDNEKLLAHTPLKKMSKLTLNLLRGIDYERIQQRRNENFLALHEALGESNQLLLEVPEAPFAYPLLVENATQLKEELLKRKIYIPTLWPNVVQNCDAKSFAYNYAKNILPIPCDQRYTLGEIEYLLTIYKQVALLCN